MNQKKEVYIPIEIKPREFVSQVYLAGELSKNGARVFIGSKSSMDRLIKEKRDNQGVYLYKGGGSSVEKFKNLSRRVTSITVLDQEVSPALINYDYIRIRFVDGCLKYVSRLYYVGKHAREAAVKCLKDIAPEKIIDSGWPRVDLWMPSMNHIWENEIRTIHSEYGNNFLLFSSDFGSNSQRLLKERAVRLELVGAKKTQYELDFIRKQHEGNFQSFHQFVDLLRKMDSDSRIPSIIVRPHPGEDHKEWFEATSNLKKTKVVYQGDISPWLLASKGLLHRGCTTAIQAAISGVKTGFLTNYSVEDSNSIVPQISPSLRSIEDIANWANNNLFELSNTKNEKVLDAHITFPPRGATETIAADMLTLAGDLVSQSNVRKKSILRKTLVKFILGLRTIKSKNMNTNKYPQGLAKLPRRNKMQDGISSTEINNHLIKMYPQESFHVMQVIDDLCLVETDRH